MLPATYKSCVWLLCLGLCGWEMSLFTSSYFAYETVVQVTYALPELIEYPTVVTCLERDTGCRNFSSFWDRFVRLPPQPIWARLRTMSVFSIGTTFSCIASKRNDPAIDRNGEQALPNRLDWVTLQPSPNEDEHKPFEVRQFLLPQSVDQLLTDPRLVLTQDS